MARHATPTVATRRLIGGWKRRRRPAEAAATLAANSTRNVVRILWAGRAFHLSEPIDLTLRRQGPYYFIGYEPLGISGYGRDQQEALKSFADVFSATWDSVAMASDTQLGREALELKRRLRNLVAGVKPG